MKTSPTGRRLIESFEGCRLRAYKCPAGIWTVGFGHTGPDVTSKTVITQAEADGLLSEDLAKFEIGVAKACAPRTPNQAQFDAMVSLSYNMGLANFRSSSVLRFFKQGDFAKAANSFALFCKARNPKTKQLEVLPGLVRRRAAEKELFLSTPTPRQVDRVSGSNKVVQVPEASVVPEQPKPLVQTKEVVGGSVAALSGVGQFIHTFTVQDAQDTKTGIVEIRQTEAPLLSEVHLTEAAAGLTVALALFIIWKRISDRKNGVS